MQLERSTVSINLPKRKSLIRRVDSVFAEDRLRQPSTDKPSDLPLQYDSSQPEPISPALSSPDIVSEWMSPIQQEFHSPSRRLNPSEEVSRDDSTTSMPTVTVELRSNDEYSTANLKSQIDNTLHSAETLVEMLKEQIIAMTTKEIVLKEAIANGRSGMSTVTVTTARQAPRTYIIRDGFWTLCNGMVQFPPPIKAPTTSLFEQLFSAPRCIGQEVQSHQDLCVFNSVIKYETIPSRRGMEYREEDYLCLKSTFKNPLEQYLSVPKHVINDTCSHGNVKSVAEYTQQCGIRIMAEYSYYPQRSSMAAELPLEYCTEKDGSCKLIVAWHMTNATIENFEFLKDEYNFKKYFMKPDHYIEHMM